MFEDKLLVLKCRRGDKAALCRVYEKYKDYLLTLARGLVSNRDDAEDIVQDAFVSFTRLARQFQLTGSLKGYLAMCVVNGSRDKIRSNTRWMKVRSKAAHADGVSNDPEQQATETEDVMRLRQALDQLPYEQRETVLLYFKGKFNFRQIARLQGVSTSTVHGRYRYGLRKLRSLLNGEVIK